MEYGQIITLLLVLFALYYGGMITMDILAANKAKAAENDKAEETEIDISELAKSFEPVVVSRDKTVNLKSQKENKESIKNKVRGKEPLMTNGILVENLVRNADRIVDPSENSDLGNIVAKCEKAA